MRGLQRPLFVGVSERVDQRSNGDRVAGGDKGFAGPGGKGSNADGPTTTVDPTTCVVLVGDRACWAMPLVVMGASAEPV